MLNRNLKPADLHLPQLRSLHCTIIGGSKRPHGKLVAQELMKYIRFSHSLYQGFELFAVGKELLFQIRGKNPLPYIADDFVWAPKAPLRHFFGVRLRQCIVNQTKYINELPDRIILPDICAQIHRIDAREAQFLLRFAQKGFGHRLAEADVPAHGRIPVAWIGVLTGSPLLEVEIPHMIQDVDMNYRMQQLGTGVDIAAAGHTEHKSVLIHYGQHLIVLPDNRIRRTVSRRQRIKLDLVCGVEQFSHSLRFSPACAELLAQNLVCSRYLLLQKAL